MIFHSRHSMLILAGVIVLAGCGPARASNTNSGRSVASAPTASELLALDRQATEAFDRGDGKFFRHLLSDNLAMQQHGSRIGKRALIEMIDGHKCTIKAGPSFTGARMLKIDDDVYVLSYVSDIQGICTADGKSVPLPSPVRAATVWVRTGNAWQVAFHGENLIVASSAPQPSNGPPGKADEAAANVNTTAAPSPVEPAADPTTRSLMKVEDSVWLAWMHKDAARLEALTAGDIAFVDLFGNYSPDKAATIGVWTSPFCDVSSVSLANGVGTIISPHVAILTVTGTVNATCGGKGFTGAKVYGNSVYVKEGNRWKWVFGFNSPRNYDSCFHANPRQMLRL